MTVLAESNARTEARALAATCVAWQTWRCTHDTNGNPRVVVVGWNAHGMIVAGGECGYAGDRQTMRDLGVDPDIARHIGTVDTATWRDALAVAEAHDSRMPWRIVWDDGEHARFVSSESKARREAGNYSKMIDKPNRQRAERVTR